MKSKKVVCTTTNKIFNSSGEAASFYNLNRSNILATCKHKNSYCGILNGEKLHWEFFDDDKYRDIIPPTKGKYEYEKEYDDIFCIYKIIDKRTGNVLYVGRTSQALRKRFLQHLANTSTYADRKLRKYNKEDLEILPITTTDDEEMAGWLEEIWTEEYGKTFSLLNTKIGDKFDNATKNKIRNSLKGYKHTDIAKSNMSKSQLGRKQTNITKEKIGSHHKIKISVVLLNTGEIFESVSDAAKKYQTRSDRILKQCKLEGRFSENVWVFKTDYDKMSNEDIQKRIFYVQNYYKIVCVETGQIFNSILETSHEMNINRKGISDSCKNGKSVKGFHFQHMRNL